MIFGRWCTKIMESMDGEMLESIEVGDYEDEILVQII